MPLVMWDRQGGVLSNHIETSRRDSLRGESFRWEAEALDRQVDQMLDRAVKLSASVEAAEAEQEAFVKRWAVGRALMESRLLESEHLEPDEKKSLWQAIAGKCRLGVRADATSEECWRGLIPERESDPKRIERDVFAIGLWLQEQELSAAILTFGARFHNARRLHGRGAINPKQLRDALARWFETLPPSLRAILTRRENFETLAKALAARFPARGPGSAKRPIHYSDADLYEEICRVLGPLAEELAPAAEQALSAQMSPR